MSAPSSEGAEPNLTPILDMVFQLITFFMLVINFKGASMDLSLKLPVLGSARPIDYQGKKQPMVLNIDTEGNINAYGQKQDLEPFIAREAKIIRDGMPPGQSSDEIPIPVIIRADKSVSFHQLNHVIKVCQSHKFLHFQLSAMSRAESK